MSNNIMTYQLVVSTHQRPQLLLKVHLTDGQSYATVMDVFCWNTLYSGCSSQPIKWGHDTWPDQLGRYSEGCSAHYEALCRSRLSNRCTGRMHPSNKCDELCSQRWHSWDITQRTKYIAGVQQFVGYHQLIPTAIYLHVLPRQSRIAILK